jgi:lysophospholipase L1-like esterase
VTIIDVAAALDYEDVPMRPALSLEAIRIIGQRGRDGWRDYEAERLRSGYRYTFDGLHPTPMGAQHIAEIIVPFIQP